MEGGIDVFILLLVDYVRVSGVFNNRKHCCYSLTFLAFGPCELGLRVGVTGRGTFIITLEEQLHSSNTRALVGTGLEGKEETN